NELHRSVCGRQQLAARRCVVKDVGQLRKSPCRAGAWAEGAEERAGAVIGRTEPALGAEVSFFPAKREGIAIRVAAGSCECERGACRDCVIGARADTGSVVAG